ETVARIETERPLRVSAGATPLYDERGIVAGAFVILRDVDAESLLYDKYQAMLDAERRAKELLEIAVTERTAQLREANTLLAATNRALDQSRREARDILDNIRQAVLTVGPDLVISREHSRHVAVVFGDAPIAERPLAEVLIGGDENAAARQRLVEWMRLA